jgi:nitrite reductase (NO-forming)
MSYVRVVFAATVAVSFALACKTGNFSKLAEQQEPLDPVQVVEQARQSAAPNVPPPIARTSAARVVLDVEIRERSGTLADGVAYTYWTFGDQTPGKFIRVREGDMVETRLSNHPDNSLAHNIDFHGATGPGGGGEASFVAPGHSASFSWRAMRPGLYLYHCVAPPAGLHIANGMYGLILVEPKGGLPPVDREYFIVQGEFYTQGKYGERGPQHFAMDKALREQPEYVVFNGQVGALMDGGALKAKVGEKVRLYLGNAGPALTSSFHVVGEIFDSVYGEGGIMPNQHNVQTTVVPVGGSAMVEFKVDVPGDYTLVDHSMFRAFNKGAMGQLRVEGRQNDAIFSGRTAESVYAPGTHLVQLPPFNALTQVAQTLPALLPGSPAEQGAQVFASICAACHQAGGQGLAGVFPPLAGSDFLMADKARSIRVLLGGLKGDVVVNGVTYRGEMPKLPLSDEQISNVLSYVRSTFGNQGDAVTLAEVKRARAALQTEPTSNVRLSTAETL